MQAFRIFLGDNDMLAYLSMMAPRLVELRSVLKPIGSIYLHCDPAASHYLKLMLDAVFGPERRPPLHLVVGMIDVTVRRSSLSADLSGSFYWGGCRRLPVRGYLQWR
jgi:hypothetical protein